MYTNSSSSKKSGAIKSGLAKTKTSSINLYITKKLVGLSEFSVVVSTKNARKSIVLRYMYLDFSILMQVPTYVGNQTAIFWKSTQRDAIVRYLCAIFFSYHAYTTNISQQSSDRVMREIILPAALPTYIPDPVP